MEHYFKDDQPLNVKAGKHVNEEIWVDDTSLVVEKQNTSNAVEKQIENHFDFLFG